VTSVVHALKTVFADPLAWLKALVLSLGIFALLYMIPVWTTPGNSIPFQWHILEPSVLFLMIVLSALNGVLFTMHLHIRAHGGKTKKAKSATTLLGIAASSFASTVACGACYSSVLAVFGLSGTIFVVVHRWWFAGGAILLSSYALYHTSRRVNHECNACEVKL
jgi:hypothetical protein